MYFSQQNTLELDIQLTFVSAFVTQIEIGKNKIFICIGIVGGEPFRKV